MSYREKEEKKPNKQPKRIIFYRGKNDVLGSWLKS